MSKKDVRIYLDDDYCEYLKTVADEKGISINGLMLELLKKKYPMPKKPKTVLSADEKESAKQRLDEITRMLDNAQTNVSAKINPKSVYLFLLDEQKRLRDLLGE